MTQTLIQTPAQATTFTPCEIAEFFAQQGEDFATALQRVMGAVEKRGVVFSPFGDAYQARCDGWLVPANENQLGASSALDYFERLVTMSRILGGVPKEFPLFEGVFFSRTILCDTVPYYFVGDRRVYLPVAWVGFSDPSFKAASSMGDVVDTLFNLGITVHAPQKGGEFLFTPKNGSWDVSYVPD
jgi:hypothetical protein